MRFDISNLNYPGMYVYVAILVTIVTSRSYMISDFNSVTSITYVPMLLWHVKASMG